MKDRSQEPHRGNRTYRIAGAVLGLLFVASGLYLVFSPPQDALRLTGAIALVALGADQLLASWRGRASWLSRIGPLP